jgi:hypothetical protein
MYSSVFTMISICVKYFGNKHNHYLSAVMVYNTQIYIYVRDTKLCIKNVSTLNK